MVTENIELLKSEEKNPPNNTENTNDSMISDELIFENAIPLSSESSQQIKTTETTETKDDDIFANAKPISEPSALEKLEYGFDKNPWVARQLLYDIPMNYLTAMFDSERDVKDVAIDREKERVEAFKKEHWKMLDGKYDGAYTLIGEVASFATDPYYIAGYYFGSPLLAGGIGGSAILNAALLGGDTLINQLATQGEITSYGDIAKSAGIGGAIGTVMPIGAKVISKYLPNKLKDKADDVASYIDGKIGNFNKLTGVEQRLIKTVANKSNIKNVTNEIDKLVLSFGVNKANNFVAPMVNAKKKFLTLKSKLYKEAFELGKQRKEILKPVKGLTQKNVASKTYYDNVVRPVKDKAKEVGKKILDIRNQVKAAREVYKGNNERLIARQTERLNKYYSLEAKRTELILQALKSEQGTASKFFQVILSNITRPLVGAATGASANIGASVLGYDVEDNFAYWAAAGFALGGFQKVIQNSAKLGGVQQKNTLLKMIDNHAVQMTFQKLRELTAGTAVTKLASFGGTTEKIGRLLLPRVDDPMSSKSVWSQSEALESVFMRKASELINKYTPEDRIKAISIVRGNQELASTSNQTILNAARDIKQWMDEFKGLYNNVGFFSRRELDDYFPRVLNWEVINADRLKAEKIFADIFQKNYKLTRDKAEKSAKTYLDRNDGIANNTVINENAFNRFINNLGRGESRPGDDLIFTPISDHITKNRMLQGEYKIVEEVLEKNNYLINDLELILPKIIQDSVKSISFAQTFGKGGQLLKPMIKEIQDKYAKLNITNQSKVQEAMKHEIRLVFDTIDAYFGRYGIKNRNVLPTTFGILTMLSNLNMLGRVSITSLGDIAQIFQNSVNYTSAIKGLGATNLFKATWEKGFARNLNYDIVNYSKESLQKSAGREAEEIILNTSWMGKFGVRGKDLATTNFYNNLAFKGLGLEWLTGYVRRFAYNAGVYDVFDLSRKLYKVSNGGKNINKQANQILADLNLYGVNQTQALNIGRFNNLKSLSKNKSAFEIVNKAGFNATNRDALIPQVGNRLLFTQSKNPFVRALGQFLSWTQAKSATTNAILKRIENGNTRTLIKTLAVLPVYAGIQQLREIAKHGDVSTDYQYNTGELAAKSWTLSGMPGWLSDMAYNRFVGPGSKGGDFFAFAPMFNMGASIIDMVQSFATGKKDRAMDILDQKILFFPEWRNWAKKLWFPKGPTFNKSGSGSKKMTFADGGFVKRKMYNAGELVTGGPLAIMKELERDVSINRKFFNEGGFASAFAGARANKEATFEWQGNVYNTRRADETEEQYQNFLGNKQEETKVEIKDKPAPDKKEITLDTIVDDLKTEAINEDPNRIFVSDLPPIKQEDIVPNQQIIYPKKKPVPENIIIPKKKPIQPKEDKGLEFPSIIGTAEAAIVEPDKNNQVVENFSKQENENTEMISAPYRLLVNSFWNKWFGKKEGEMFTNNDFDKGTVNVLQTVAKNALDDGRGYTHYTDYPLTARGVSAEALVGEYKDKNGNLYSAEYKKKLEDEVNKVYPNNLFGKAKFAYDLATDPVMKAIFSIGGFSIQENNQGYFINERFNFNTANKTEGTALKKVRKIISNMKDAPMDENEGPEVFITLGKFDTIKLAKKAKGGIIKMAKGDTPSVAWMRDYYFDGKGGYDTWMSFDEFIAGPGKTLYLDSRNKSKGGVIRKHFRYGGDTMGGPNDRSNAGQGSGSQGPAGGQSSGGNYGGGNNNRDRNNNNGSTARERYIATQYNKTKTKTSNTGGGNGGSSSNNNNNTSNNTKSNKTNTKDKRKTEVKVGPFTQYSYTNPISIESITNPSNIGAEVSGGVQAIGPTFTGKAYVSGSTNLENVGDINKSFNIDFSNQRGFDVNASYDLNNSILSGNVSKYTDIGNTGYKVGVGVDYNDGNIGPSFQIKKSFKKGGLLDKKRG